MFYIIYKTTNIINNKFYIGKHQTTNLNDEYMGSGKILKYAIKKYGIKNFKKEILYTFKTEKEMNDKEKELVIISDNTYNLCEGGKGGFSFINRTRNHVSHNKKLAANRDYSLTDRSYITDDYRNNARNKTKDGWANGTITFIPTTKGLKYSDEQKQSLSQKGSKNSQHGSMWITNNIENKKIKKYVDSIPDGWYKGRVVKHTT